MRICLLAEGSYPYVVGGVSSWVQMLIQGMPEHEFVIYTIGAEEKNRGDFKYKLPPNVVGVKEIFLDTVLNMQTKFRGTISLDKAEKKVLTDLLMNEQLMDLTPLSKLFRKRLSKENFLHIFMSFDFFDIIIEVYRKKYSYLSFTDYFWTIRSLLLPLFFLLQDEIPEADLYHSVATGYCGIVGALAAQERNKPYIITEHGIYSREREEEIIKSDWVKGDFKSIWIEYFYQQAYVAYRQANQVITLFEGNRNTEISLGCNPDKISIITNGVRIENFVSITHEADPDGSFVLGAIVRVVPIKDILTMLRAFSLVQHSIPNSKLYVMGPYAEDPEYYEECKLLVKSLQLQNVVFTGSVNVREYLGKMDLLLLSSISEGQPLALLEGFAAGVASVTTDVGCCREVIYGSGDDNLGDAGVVVPVMDFEGMAEAVIKLARDNELRSRMAQIGRERIIRYYSYDGFIDSYKKVYSSYDKCLNTISE